MKSYRNLNVNTTFYSGQLIQTDNQTRSENINLLQREGRIGECWPGVVAVHTERSEVRKKTTESQCSPVRLEQARLVSSLFRYGIRAMLVLNLPAFENKKYTAYDSFRGNGLYGKIPTKKEPIRTLGFP